MDPNATLAELRRLVEEYWDEGESAGLSHRFADCVDALDSWVSRGGFLPDAWGGSRIAGERFYA